MSVFDRLAKESEAERQEWARRNAQTSAESSSRVHQDLSGSGRGGSLFDRLEKESEAERKEWASRNAKTALESSQRAGTELFRERVMEELELFVDYRAGGSELATPASSGRSAPVATLAVGNDIVNWGTVAEHVKSLINAQRDRYHEAVKMHVKTLDRETNEALSRAISQINPKFNDAMDDYTDAVSSQAMNYCKVTPNVDRAKWSQALKNFTGLMQGVRSELSAVQNSLIKLPEWTKTADVLAPALHSNIDKQFGIFNDALSGTIGKITV